MKTTRTGKRAGGSTVRVPRGRSRKIGKVIELVPSLIELKSIVVPIDFSATSRKALAYAVRLAEQFGGRITLVNVIEPIAAPEFAAVSMLIENDTAKKAAKAKLEDLVKELKIPSRLVEKVLVRFGAPFAEITTAARTLKADLIILTTHGYTGLKHVLMGSTAERVVRHAPCPVLTVRDKRR